jgi:3-carboxy-cis,cis-muconate cycloisomerase
MAADVLWPGLHRAADAMATRAVLEAMLEVEAAWAQALEEAALAPASLAVAVRTVFLDDQELEAVAVEAEAGGNPLIPLLARVRAQVGASAPSAAAWVHLGLTSQDVIDSALMLLTVRVLGSIEAELARQRLSLTRLCRAHRDTPMLGRTLGQAAVPTTFGAKAASWLRGLQACAPVIARAREEAPAQVGGAAGTLAAVVEMSRVSGCPDPVLTAGMLAKRCAEVLGLRPAPPWHTVRTPITKVGDALTTLSDALGHIAGDVVLLSRPELGEVSEPTVEGRGGSSAMPQKRNPVLSVLVRRHSMSAPLLAAQLHLAAAGAVDERPDGAWHEEWAPLRDLATRTLAAARQTTELLEGLEVHSLAMRANLDAALPGAIAERQSVRASLAAPADPGDLLDPTAYLGATERLVDETTSTETF